MVTLQRLVERQAWNAKNPRHRGLLFAETLPEGTDWVSKQLVIIQRHYRAAMHDPDGSARREWLADAFALIARRPPPRVERVSE